VPPEIVRPPRLALLLAAAGAIDHDRVKPALVVPSCAVDNDVDRVSCPAAADRRRGPEPLATALPLTVTVAFASAVVGVTVTEVHRIGDVVRR